MTQLFTNNATSALAAPITNVATSLVLNLGAGAKFPSLVGVDFFMLTLLGLNTELSESSWEIVKVTARSADTLTVVRAQENTAAVAWASGTRVEHRNTANTLKSLLQKADNLADLDNASTARTNLGLGATYGYAPLDSGSKVSATYLPSYVDDVLEVANLAALPVTGEAGKIYTTLDTNKIYRWSGSSYVNIAASPGSTDAVTEGSTNIYFTVARTRAALSAGGALAYNASTGAYSYTPPTYHLVASSGSYTDLINKPVMPTLASLGGQPAGSYPTGSGTVSGANTGDQTLPTLASLGGQAALGFTPYNATNPSSYTTLAAVASVGYATGGGSATGSNTGDQTNISGNASTANSATIATNILGGTTGQIPYQSASGVTSFAGPGTAGQVLTSNGVGAPTMQTAGSFVSGTRLVFAQTAAPTGWTKDVTNNDAALRVVSGVTSSGGTTAFSTIFASGGLATSAIALSASQVPSHNHSVETPGNQSPGQWDPNGLGFWFDNTWRGSDYRGGNGAHSHTTTMQLKYVDVIVATRD